MIDSTNNSYKRTRLGRAIRMALISSLCIGFAVAHAQDSDGDEGSQEPGAEAGSQDRITVTARRRDEDLQDVPISVTALSGGELEDFGAQDITFLNRVVPNATIETSRGTNNTLTAFIRGVGQQDPVAGFEAGVGIYIDDVYLNRPQGALLEVYDVERIEVLRGPQGTLYGRNTIGGAVKYVTRRLGNEPSLSVEGSYGSYNQADFIVSAETPIGDTFAIGASAATFNRDGFGENRNLGEDNYNKELLAFRGSAEWTPTDRFFARVTADREDENFTQIDFEALPAQDVDVPAIYENEQFTQEFQLAYTGDRISGIAGFYYIDANAFNVFDVVLATTGDLIGLPGLTAQTEGDVDTESWSVFADVSFDLASYLGLNTGLELSI